VQFTVFDAPLHYNFKEAGDAKSEYDLRKIWDGTIVQSRPMDAVTLVDNHDTQVGQALQSWVSSGFKPLAYAMILLRTAGYPCVFYGDLYGPLVFRLSFEKATDLATHNFIRLWG
jgi:alpha-amylase